MPCHPRLTLHHPSSSLQTTVSNKHSIMGLKGKSRSQSCKGAGWIYIYNEGVVSKCVFLISSDINFIIQHPVPLKCLFSKGTLHDVKSTVQFPGCLSPLHWRWNVMTDIITFLHSPLLTMLQDSPLTSLATPNQLLRLASDLSRGNIHFHSRFNW